MDEKFKVFCKMVGLNIKKIRHQNALSRVELAKKAGIAMISLGKIERGEYGAKLETLFHISSVLNVRLAELLSDDSILILDKEKLSVLLSEKENT